MDGSKPGVGKTACAKALAILVDGRFPATISFTRDEAELEKAIATRVKTGDRVIVVDNAKSKRAVKYVDSPTLERCVSDAVLNLRLLRQRKHQPRQ